MHVAYQRLAVERRPGDALHLGFHDMRVERNPPLLGEIVGRQHELGRAALWRRWGEHKAQAARAAVIAIMRLFDETHIVVDGGRRQLVDLVLQMLRHHFAGEWDRVEKVLVDHMGRDGGPDADVVIGLEGRAQELHLGLRALVEVIRQAGHARLQRLDRDQHAAQVDEPLGQALGREDRIRGQHPKNSASFEWRCAFIRPGMTSLPAPSITVASVGAWTAAPIAVIRSPSTKTSPVNGSAPCCPPMARIVAPLINVVMLISGFRI